MAYSLTWLAEVLEDASLKVAEVPGWRTSGRGDMGPVKGVMCHHTAGPATGNMPSLGIITKGRPDLAGLLRRHGNAGGFRGVGVPLLNIGQIVGQAILPAELGAGLGPCGI